MANIDVNDDTYRALELLASAWRISPADAVARLVDAVAHDDVDRHDCPSSPPGTAGERVGCRADRNALS